MCVRDSSSEGCAKEQIFSGDGRAGSETFQWGPYVMAVVQVYVFPCTAGCKHCQL